MGMAFLLTLSLAIAPEAWAKPKRSGASTMPDFVTCVQEAVIGRTDGDCGRYPESEPCVGMRRAFENSQKKTECQKTEQGVCRLWSHNGWSESKWISVAAGHLANFGECVKKQYGSETSSGLKEALNDPSLVAFVKKLEDGGKVFRLSDSALLMGALRGDRLSTLIENSPFAKERSPHDLYLLKGAADTPSPLASTRQVEGEGSNPALEGEDFTKLARGLLGEPEDVAISATLESSGEGRTDPLKIAAAKSFYQLRFSTPPPAPRAPASRMPYSLGLDRTIFERVSSAYRRNSQSLSGMEEYLKAYAPEPPKDYSDLLRRGGTL